MMEELARRGEQLARDRQQRRLAAIAGQLRAMLGSAAVERGAQVEVRGRGLIRRWLLDPRLRFLRGARG
jgi:hypothetical protein